MLWKNDAALTSESEASLGRHRNFAQHATFLQTIVASVSPSGLPPTFLPPLVWSYL